MSLLRGFDKVRDLGVANGYAAVRQSCHVTLISDIAEGILVQSHNLKNSRNRCAGDLEVKGDCHKLNKEVNTKNQSTRSGAKGC